jgi:hypothetical protein
MSVALIGGTTSASAALAFNAQTGTTYTFVLADADNKLVIYDPIELNNSISYWNPVKPNPNRSRAGNRSRRIRSYCSFYWCYCCYS